MLKVKIKKLCKEAVVPKYTYQGDAGMDVVSISKEESGGLVIYKTGLSFEVPEGYVMLVFPRSSLSKKELILANHVGVLDSGYRGELIFKFRKCGKNHYKIGERIGQIMIIPYPKIEFEEVDTLFETERGKGAFGSSGF